MVRRESKSLLAQADEEDEEFLIIAGVLSEAGNRKNDQVAESGRRIGCAELLAKVRARKLV